MDILNTTMLTAILKKSEDINGKTSGLYYGKAGNVILLYLLAKRFRDPLLSEKASALLNSIGDSIAEIENLDFARGLAGIGWAIECVAQNNFLEMNTNEILEDIHDVLYKSIVYTSDNNISLAYGTLGKFNYFLSRYKSKNQNTQRLKNIFHEECLILLTDDLNEKLIGESGILRREVLNNNDLINVGHSIYFLSAFLSYRVNEVIVETTLYETIKFVDEYLSKKRSNNDEVEQREYLLFLSTCYWLSGENHQHNYWKEKSKNFITFYKNSLNVIPDHNTPSFEKKVSLLSLIAMGEFDENDSLLRNLEIDDDPFSVVSLGGKLITKNCIGEICKQNGNDLLLMI